MGWEIKNGRRYFYETTYTDGKRTRKCWGSGLKAHQAEIRVNLARAQERLAKARLDEAKARDRYVDALVADFNHRIRDILNQTLQSAGIRYSCGQYRVIRNK